MNRPASDPILEEWTCRRRRGPAAGDAAATGRGPRAVRPALSLAGASLVAVVARSLAAVWLGRPGSTGPGGLVPLRSAIPRRSPTPARRASARPRRRRRRARRRRRRARRDAVADRRPRRRRPPPSARATPATSRPGSPCWEGAAGSRIADVELTNAGAGACTLETLERPQLIDGPGRVLIDGATPATPQRPSRSLRATSSRPSSRPATTAAPRPVAPVQRRLRLARRQPVHRRAADAYRRDRPAVQRSGPARRHRDAAVGALMRGPASRPGRARLLMVVGSRGRTGELASAGGAQPTLAQLDRPEARRPDGRHHAERRPARPNPARRGRWRDPVRLQHHDAGGADPA